ncbi:MAG: hypothetical protein QGH12_07415, partial [SAR324 cluster bacterium]|nr:hypothetical protein [SAR324 cluster bacterium]
MAAPRDEWNCVSPQQLRLPVHHQYAILPLSTNTKATSAPARSRCCNSYWLSGVLIRTSSLFFKRLYEKYKTFRAKVFRLFNNLD